MLFLRQIQCKAKPVAEEIICDPFLISLPLYTQYVVVGGGCLVVLCINTFYNNYIVIQLH